MINKELKKPYTFTLKPSIREKLEKLGEKENISSSGYIEKMVREREECTTLIEWSTHVDYLPR